MWSDLDDEEGRQPDRTLRDRLFDGSLSPLARLLDWLAWRYQVLFVVSAGNHHRIELSVPRGALSTLAPEELQNHVLHAVAADARHRRLLSPAEGVNALTVGAVYDDASTGDPPTRWVHPYVSANLPSPINAQGLGYRRAIKPDILAPGRRLVVQEYLGSTGGVGASKPVGADGWDWRSTPALNRATARRKVYAPMIGQNAVNEHTSQYWP